MNEQINVIAANFFHSNIQARAIIDSHNLKFTGEEGSGVLLTELTIKEKSPTEE